MSIVKKGKDFEDKISQELHSRFIPVLLSDLILRELSLGQVDVSYMIKSKKLQQIILIECKSSLVPGRIQNNRLRRTQDYLSKLLNMEVILKLKFCQKVQA